MRGMLAAFAVAIAACAGLTPQARAQQRDASAIAGCVASAPDRAALEGCKRRLVTACVEEPENANSTMGIVLCTDREWRAWQALLDRQTARIGGIGDGRAERFALAQAAWEAWRDAECDYHRADAAGGSGEQVVMVGCTLDLTADRVISLTLLERSGGSVY